MIIEDGRAVDVEAGRASGAIAAAEERLRVGRQREDILTEELAEVIDHVAHRYHPSQFPLVSISLFTEAEK